MKDHVEIGHFTKYDAFRMNRDQAMNLEMWFKIHTNVSVILSVNLEPNYLLLSYLFGLSFISRLFYCIFVFLDNCH